MKKSIGPMTMVCTTPVWIVGSYDKAGKPNIMTAAWGGVCCSEPPCIAVSLRKATYTYHNIMERKAFTINIPSEDFSRETDYIGMGSGRTIDKFHDTRLTPVGSKLVDAPYVQEFPLVIECRLLESFELGLHTQFVGEIMDVKADESVLDDDGLPVILRVRPIIFDTGSQSYYGAGDFIGKAFLIGTKVR